MTAAGERERLASVDGLRAIAALLVVWTHIAETYVTVTSTGTWLHRVAYELDLGRAGVVAFFAISGFVIPSSLRGPKPQGIRRFAIRRFFRLYPAYWLSIPLGLVTSWWMSGRSPGSAAIAANITMLPDAFGAPKIQGLYWTLEIELVFYGICAIAFWMNWLHLAAALRWLTLGFAAMFVALYLAKVGVFDMLCLNLSTMFWGALWRKRHAGELRAVADRCLAWAVPAGWIALAAASAAWLHKGRFPIATALGVAMFALATTLLPIRSRVLAWMGEISYSIYLFHPVVFYALIWAIGRSGVGWFGNVHLGVYILTGAALSIAFAALVYKFVERPAIELGKRIAA